MNTTPPKQPATQSEYLASAGCHIGSAYPLGSSDPQLSISLDSPLLHDPDYRPYAQWVWHAVKVTYLP